MFLKRLIIILVCILVAAAGFQLLRSSTLFRLIKNVNAFEELQDPRSLDIPEGINPEKYLIVSDKNEENSLKTEEQLKKVLDYMKKDYLIAEVGEKFVVNLNFDCIFFTFERLDYLDNMQDYLDYVEAGGSLVFLARPLVDESFISISNRLGIKKYDGINNDASGIKMLSDIMIGTKDFESSTDMIRNSSIDLILDDNVKVYISSYDDLPLLWEKDYGRGSFIVFNGTMLNEKCNRGLITGVISLGRDNLIYPIINIKVMCIDDFPAPIPEGINKEIFEEFNRDIPQFYREVWWSDMIKISKNYDFKYSGFVIQNYGDNVKPPFEKGRYKNTENLLIYGKELLGIGGEMGLHGYNHQSLALEGYIKQDLGYNSWESEEDMGKSIEELIKFIHNVFRSYELRAYVPPSNILSEEGRRAITGADPDLGIISSVYLINAEGDAYTQEFELGDGGILEIPRLTSGYEKTDENMWLIYNGANLPGVFTHFIHPDDILDPERSHGKSWTELHKEFESMAKEVSKKYSWLRGFTISSAGQELIKYLDCEPIIDYSDDSIDIYIKNFREDIYCIMRTEDRITDVLNCEYKKIAEDAYLLTLKDVHSKINLD